MRCWLRLATCVDRESKNLKNDWKTFTKTDLSTFGWRYWTTSRIYDRKKNKCSKNLKELKLFNHLFGLSYLLRIKIQFIYCYFSLFTKNKTHLHSKTKQYRVLKKITNKETHRIKSVLICFVQTEIKEITELMVETRFFNSRNWTNIF